MDLIREITLYSIKDSGSVVRALEKWMIIPVLPG